MRTTSTTPTIAEIKWPDSPRTEEAMGYLVRWVERLQGKGMVVELIDVTHIAPTGPEWYKCGWLLCKVTASGKSGGVKFPDDSQYHEKAVGLREIERRASEDVLNVLQNNGSRGYDLHNDRDCRWVDIDNPPF